MCPCLTPDHEAITTIAAWKDTGKRVVFTNGCFDLLHPGHINYIEQAKALGDKLIIGLNDDASIQQLKGTTRPLNPLDDRALMLMALKSVDMVVAFPEETPLNLITTLMPDILVKGGDYTPDTIVGAKEVRANGGQVVVVPFRDGYSTTILINRIQQLNG